MNRTTRYGIQVIGCINAKTDTIITSRYISEKEQISQGVIMKILRKLADAGIVASHQGRGCVSGGFSLAKDIKTVTLYDLFMALEDGVCLYLPEVAKESEYTHLIDNELEKIDSLLKNELKDKTLYDILCKN